jgi:LPS export ABC transporter protein LptC
LPIPRNTKKLKVALVLVIVVTCAVVAAVFWGYRRMGDQRGRLLAALKTKANLSLHRVYQTATKDGIKEWSLEAASAEYVESSNEALLQDISVTFFTQDARKIFLTADRGTLQTVSSDMEVRGNVVLINQDFRLETQSLHYAHNQHRIFSQEPVTLTGESIRLVGDSMTHDLKTNQTMLEGHVEGTFLGNMLL